MTVTTTVGIVGLGIMGSAIAWNLIKQGFKIVGCDIDATKTKAVAASGGIGADSPRRVAEQADLVITLLPSELILHEVVTAKGGLISAGNRNLIVADCGTFDITEKQRCHSALTAAAMGMLDCTISGTGSQAKEKDLVVYASGEESHFALCQPVFAGFARESHFVGEFGNASKVKYVANLLVAIHNVAAAEAMVFAQQAGLDLRAVYDLIRIGAGNSRMFELRAPMMVAGEYDKGVASKLDLWQKDMRVIGEFARNLKCPLPLFSASAQIYTAAVTQGYAKSDMAAVCAVMEELAGIKRRSTEDDSASRP
ncbi:MAG: NAD(P)-dependent oxidoreductase [Betaproteobacteria bacterium]